LSLALQSRTEHAKAVVDALGSTKSLTLSPQDLLKNCKASLKPKEGKGRKGKPLMLTVTSPADGKVYTVKGDWDSSTTEAVLQTHAIDVSQLLNGMKNLFWDFNISGKPTLGPFKPDGHARLVGAKAPLHASNVLQTAVLVALKATPSLLTDDTQGRL
jgi:hypothetical protein